MKCRQSLAQNICNAHTSHNTICEHKSKRQKKGKKIEQKIAACERDGRTITTLSHVVWLYHLVVWFHFSHFGFFLSFLSLSLSLRFPCVIYLVIAGDSFCFVLFLLLSSFWRMHGMAQRYTMCSNMRRYVVCAGEFHLEFYCDCFSVWESSFVSSFTWLIVRRFRWAFGVSPAFSMREPEWIIFG